MSEFVITGKILDFNSLDRQGEMISPDCDIELEQNIPVKLDWGEDPRSMMGFATIEKKEDGIWATMKIHVPDGIPSEAVKKMKPCIGGTVYEKESFHLLGKDEQERQFNARLNILKRIKISSIGLCLLNVDYSIKTLEEMENDART